MTKKEATAVKVPLGKKGTTTTATKAKGTNGATPRQKKEGLRVPQVRALEALAKAKGLMTKRDISEQASIDPAWIGAAIGSHDPEKRERIETRNGYKSLVSLGLVRVKRTTPEEGAREETVFEITAPGRKALAAVSK